MDLYNRLNETPFIIAGPCVIEGEEMLHSLAGELKEICGRHKVPFVFKASFDKANRTSLSSFRGPGIEEGLRLLSEVRKAHDVPILTDIHETHQAEKAAEAADILQIPAFLCRQSDLLVAAGETGRIVNIKKGQFLHAEDMAFQAEKVKSTGNKNIILTERGSSFGYRDLVVDFRGLEDMKKAGYPVVLDVTHSVQRPGGAGGKTGGAPEYIPVLSRAGAAVGVSGFFFEVHSNPSEAKSDGPNMLTPGALDALIPSLLAILAIPS